MVSSPPWISTVMPTPGNSLNYPIAILLPRGPGCPLWTPGPAVLTVPSLNHSPCVGTCSVGSRRFYDVYWRAFCGQTWPWPPLAILSPVALFLSLGSPETHRETGTPVLVADMGGDARKPGEEGGESEVGREQSQQSGSSVGNWSSVPWGGPLRTCVGSSSEKGRMGAFIQWLPLPLPPTSARLSDASGG